MNDDKLITEVEVGPVEIGGDVHEVWRDALADVFEYTGKRIRATDFQFNGMCPKVSFTVETRYYETRLLLEVEQGVAVC